MGIASPCLGRSWGCCFFINEGKINMSRNARLSDIKAKINKDHGNKLIDSARCVVIAPRLSTGSLSFDRGLGGGIPVGQPTLFYGGESSGKTTTAYRIAGLAQKLCANCLRPVVGEITYEWVGDTEVASAYCDCYKKGIFKPTKNQGEKDADFKERIASYEVNSYQEFTVALFDMEGAFDRPWAQKLGLRPGPVVYIRPDSAEEAIDAYEALIRSAAVDLFILDSLAAMIPSEEITKSSSEATQGLQARKLGLWNRKVSAALSSIRNDYKAAPTQIWINQEREKIGVSWGDNKVCPGGKSQKFYASTIVKMWTEKWEVETLDEDLPEELRAKVGSMVKMGIKIDKCRLAPSKYQATYPMIVMGDKAGQIDDTKYFLAMAEKFGLMRTEGEGPKKKWWVGDQEYSKKGDAMAKVMEPQTNAIMRRIVMDNLLGIKDGEIIDG
jgi:RecA/RadA recombinase